jgi:hypothetical protein
MGDNIFGWIGKSCFSFYLHVFSKWKIIRNEAKKKVTRGGRYFDT